MGHRLRIIQLAVVLMLIGVVAAGCSASTKRGSPAPAGGQSTQASGGQNPASGGALQSILQDDDQLIYSPPAQVVRTLRRLKALGVDVVKVSMVWWIVAPDPNSTRHPNFNASDPAAYQWGIWNRYDLVVEEAHRLGLKVYFQFAPPDPAWAPAPGLPRGQGKPLGQSPDLKYFNQFVQAVGRRYSGTWRGTRGGLIPRVSYWGIWNEPNWINWLNPWHGQASGVRELTQPMLYRGLVNAAWRGLEATGHGGDTILIGESANIGIVPPVRFLEDLYCVDGSYQELTGRAADAAGCPTSANRAEFVSGNPGLFHIAGYAHHPYAFDIPPSQPSRVHTELALYNIGRLERVVNGIFNAYGQARRGGIPLYLSEWGYVTNPPNPAYHTTLQEQAVWLNEGEYMMWRLPFVRALAQFLLVDVAPASSRPTRAQWLHVFATGLLFHSGAPKPSLAAYRLPIWLPVGRHGPRVTVWGQLRPADHTSLQRGLIEFRAQGSPSWTVLSRVETSNPEGFFLRHVAIPSAGEVRIAWRSLAGSKFFSRAAAVS